MRPGLTLTIGLVIAAAGGFAIVTATDDDAPPTEPEHGAGPDEAELRPVPGPRRRPRTGGRGDLPRRRPTRVQRAGALTFVWARGGRPARERQGLRRDAAGAGRAATVEGPALVILRVLADGSVERYELDSFGRGPIVQRCEALQADGEVIPPGAPAAAESPSRLDAIECDRPRGLP